MRQCNGPHYTVFYRFELKERINESTEREREKERKQDRKEERAGGKEKKGNCYKVNVKTSKYSVSYIQLHVEFLFEYLNLKFKFYPKIILDITSKNY